MQFRPLALRHSLFLIALSLSGLTHAAPDDASPSLYERRLGIIKGTSKGIVLLEATPSAPESPEKKAQGQIRDTSPATNDVAPKAADTRPSGQTGFLTALPPPSGRSLDTARRLGAPGGGIPMPTARAASAPQAATTATP